MRLLSVPLALMLIVTAGMARGNGEKAGTFDYYVLSLSWSPTWCALEGDARHSPQCATGKGFGWVLHGLWPQNTRGWPSYCRTPARDPSRRQTAAMADIMGASGAAWYQWKKHGRCSGLTAADYFDTARRAYRAIRRPDVFRRLHDSVKLPAHVVEEAFLKANPALKADQITITCKAGRVQEVRICLTKDLTPRMCGNDVVHDCSLQDALLEPVR